MRKTSVTRWPTRFTALPPAERFGGVVHERNAVRHVRGNHSIADGLQRRREPPLPIGQLRVHPVLVESHLDGRSQLSLVERLQQIAEGLRSPRPLQRGSS